MFEFFGELFGGLLWFWKPAPHTVRRIDAVFVVACGALAVAAVVVVIVVATRA